MRIDARDSIWFFQTADQTPKRAPVGVPFAYRNAHSQLVAGFIDLLLETEDGCVIIDDQTYPGPQIRMGGEGL